MDDTTTTPYLRLRTPTPVRRGHLALGEPVGAPDRIEVTSNHLERNGTPWFPITGEVHYSRIPRERWSQVLGHAKAGGLTSVATYVFWQAHEPSPGEFDWDGNLDLRAFIETAVDHDLDVVVRLGPWAHGELRHGGFPDWLLDRDVVPRTDDPAYLDLVRRFYAETIAQFADLTHERGGPVVGAQVDNELYDQPQHLATLRELAQELGLRVPVWTATGWGGAQVPNTLLPVYSAYGDGFWEEATTQWPAFAALHYRYSTERDDLSVGADLREALDGIVLEPGQVPLKDDRALPFATCELGGGMHVAYHRRPLVTSQDIAALALAKIGSGSIWQGYYMYAGGTQRRDAGGTQQESHATGYPNDLPTLSYDFFAPVGEHAQIRDHHHLLRRQHLWLAQEGAALATMATTIGGGSEDPAELRWAVRSDGFRGYLFLTTYQPAGRPLPAQGGVQITVGFEDGEVTVPSSPVDVPTGVSVAWPLRYQLSATVLLLCATAQLLTRVQVGTEEFVVLVAAEGIRAELVLSGHHEVGGAGRGRPQGTDTLVDLTRAPGPDTVVELADGLRVLVLDEASADQVYDVTLNGVRRLVRSDVPLYAGEGGLVLHTDRETASIAVLPDIAGLGSSTAEITREPVPERQQGPWRSWAVTVHGSGVKHVAADLHPVTAAAPEPRRGGPMDRLSAPTDFSGAARVHVAVPAEVFEGTDRVLLRVRWSGDVGRAVLSDGEVVSDHFWHGRDWEVDLTPWREEVTARGLTLELLPWRRSTGVFVDASLREVPEGIHITSLDLVRVARVVLTPRT